MGRNRHQLYMVVAVPEAWGPVLLKIAMGKIGMLILIPRLLAFQGSGLAACKIL